MEILIATDGSPCSDAAVREVARRQLPAGSQMRVVSVVEPRGPLTSGSGISSANFFKDGKRVDLNQALDALDRAVAELREAGGTQLYIGTKVLVGSPKRAIVEDAERWGAGLIVVGSHGYGALKRFLMGSVSRAVALHAHCPVEIVRCHENK